MIKQNDWRLTNQMDYLFEKQLMHKKYKQPRPGWDHDHCEFCNATIDESTKLAYCTSDEYYWICEPCFNDFHKMFKWEVAIDKK